MTEAIVQTRDLTKRYGPFTALHELNMQIDKGAIHGFIGPNGAGKTTTMRILATLLEPTYGEAWVSGYPVMQAPHDVRRHIGYMPDFFGVYDNMKVWEYLDFFAASYNVPQSRRKGMIDDLLALVDLTAKHDSFVDDLSRGMKQRLCLARTLVHEPDLLILDEPASGLDPHARIELRELLKELRRLGKTILISSHILTELAEMCTHIAIIERGTLLLSGSVAEILQAMQPAREIYVRVLDRANDGARLLETLPGVLSVKILPPGYLPNQRLHQSGVAQPVSPQVPPQPILGNGGAVSHIPPPPGAIPPPPTDALSADEVMYGPVRVATAGPATIYMRMNGDDALLSTILSYLVRHEIPVFGFEEAMSNLEDIFLRTTKGLVQ